ncbi:hypothetical protein BJY04DRAFT_217715 [Aspergillus karnatakaensis]|uniref:uncharacterized protein n=1 Tax=Aspergillus karnatakaensis TaxID=1810916 RepID=UPI003CCDBBE8
MTTLEDPCLREDDRQTPLKEPPSVQDDPPGQRSLSSSLKSNASRSIYDALRASSSNEEETTTSGDQSCNNVLEMVDNRLAANVAQFYSAADDAPNRTRGGSAPDPSTKQIQDDIDKPPRAHLMADKLRIGSTGEVTAWSLPDRLTDFAQEEQQSSLTGSSYRDNDNASAPQQPGWPKNIKSPVSPTLPEFPPPVRSPTPPGLPSFGTEEARSYDFRIGARPPDPSHSESLLRRLFQRGVSPPQGSQQPPPRVYAEDGTAVLGSFPQRQSGHGTSGSKGIDNHPFHQRNLPVAQYDGTSAEAIEPSSVASADSYWERGEATLQWLLSDRARRRSPPDSTPSNPALPPLGGSVRRPDSYQTCVSGVQEPNTQGRNVRPGQSTLADQCFLAPTQSAVPTIAQEGGGTGDDATNNKQYPSLGKQFMEGARYVLCCCRGAEEEPEAPRPNPINTTITATTATTTNTTTQDTYVTARDQTSNEPQQPRPILPTGSPSAP